MIARRRIVPDIFLGPPELLELCRPQRRFALREKFVELRRSHRGCTQHGVRLPAISLADSEATTNPATSITFTSAVLNGTANPTNPDSEYYFNYGTTTSYGQQTTPNAIGSRWTEVPRCTATMRMRPAASRLSTTASKRRSTAACAL